MTTIDTTDEEDPPAPKEGEERQQEENTTSLEDLPYVGAATASTLAAAGITAADVDEKTVSYRELVEAGVNPGVAGKLRREHSLHWTHDEEEFELDRRSKGVRGLRDGEREWVASPEPPELSGSEGEATQQSTDAEDSATADNQWPDTTEGRAETAKGAGTTDETERIETGATTSDDPFSAEAAWRARASSPSVATIEPVPADAESALESAGVGTVRQLATADVDRLATELELDRERIDYWQALAAQRIEDG